MEVKVCEVEEFGDLDAAKEVREEYDEEGV